MYPLMKTLSAFHHHPHPQSPHSVPNRNSAALMAFGAKDLFLT